MSITKDPAPLWQRRRHESARAYVAFTAYRDTAAGERSIDKAYRISSGGGENAARAPRRWFRWSRQFDWVGRSKAFDEHLATLDLAEREKAAKVEALEWSERRRLLRDRKWRISQALIDKAESVLKLPIVRSRLARDGGTTVVEPVHTRLSDAARMGDIAARLGQEAIDDARLEAEQSGGTGAQIENCVFRVQWLDPTEDTEEETAPDQQDPL